MNLILKTEAVSIHWRQSFRIRECHWIRVKQSIRMCQMFRISQSVRISNSLHQAMNPELISCKKISGKKEQDVLRLTSKCAKYER